MGGTLMGGNRGSVTAGCPSARDRQTPYRQRDATPLALLKEDQSCATFTWRSDVVGHLESDTVLSCKCCAALVFLEQGKWCRISLAVRCLSVPCRGASGRHRSPVPPHTVPPQQRNPKKNWAAFPPVLTERLKHQHNCKKFSEQNGQHFLPKFTKSSNTVKKLAGKKAAFPPLFNREMVKSKHCSFAWLLIK